MKNYDTLTMREVLDDLDGAGIIVTDWDLVERKLDHLYDIDLDWSLSIGDAEENDDDE